MTRSFLLWRSLGLLILIALLHAPDASAQAQPQAAVDGCVTCHLALPQQNLSSPVTAFRGDIHNSTGFHCVDCHGGDPTTRDKARAKDPSTGYRGKPVGAQIIATCSKCHSDAEFMRKFAPKQRVDQATEYATSIHGIRLAAGDHKVATCASCHHAHGIRQVNDARAPVFSTNVAVLCASCHSSADYMKGETLPGGLPIPTTQREDYEKSVHAAALMKRNDLSAPTCNDCHGNHGAAPPGVGAVSNVCGTCHAIFAAKFAKSAHAQVFDRACVECHSNHTVLPTSDEMIGTSKTAVCSNCHTDQDDTGFVAAGKMRASLDRLKTSLDANTALIAQVRNEGMEVSDQELALSEIRAKLTQARTEIHSFDPAAVDAVVDEGVKALSAVEQAGNKAAADLRFRRTGLFISLGAIMLVVIALALKVRELNASRH